MTKRRSSRKFERVLVGVVVALAGWLAAAPVGAGDDPLPSLGSKTGTKAFPGGLPALNIGESGDDAPVVTLWAVASMKSVAPGGQFAVAVILNFKEGWHAWPAREQDLLPEAIQEFAINTSIELGDADWVGGVGAVQWPEPHEEANPLGDPPTVKAFSGRAVAFLPLVVSEDAGPGLGTLEVTVGYQACDATSCQPPESKTLTIALEIVADITAAVPNAGDALLFSGFDAAGFETIGQSGPAVVRDDPASPPGLFGGPGGWILLLLLAALGGAVLNLTPCVLPVIPIKVMTLTQHASGSRTRTLYLGAWMAAGVVAFWVGIGVPAVLFSSFADPSVIFGIWWVTGGIGLLLALMALGLMGLFSITLPQKTYRINPNAENASGSFLFGVMTGVLGLPCFGFVAGALLSAAAAWPKSVTFGVFAGIGVGMALPYLVLAAKPSLLSAVPKTGPASELVKQVMGLLLLAASVFFIGAGVLAFVGGNAEWLSAMPWWGRVAHYWVITVFAVLAGGWLLIRTVQITPKPGLRMTFGALGLIIGGAATLYTVDASIKARSDVWVPYSEAVWRQALDSGEVVVVDFTAEWCLNCKALKAAVLSRDPVKGEFLGSGVTPMVADLTSRKAAGWDKLRALGRTGIPTLAIWGPGLPEDEPWISNAYTAEQVMVAIDRARGTAAVAESSP